MRLASPRNLSIRTTLTLWYCVVFCLGVCLMEAVVYLGVQAAMTAAVDSELDARIHGFDEFLQEHLGRLPLPRVLADLQVHFALQPELSMLQDEQGHTLYCGSLVQPLCGRPAQRSPKPSPADAPSASTPPTSLSAEPAIPSSSPPTSAPSATC